MNLLVGSDPDGIRPSVTHFPIGLDSHHANSGFTDVGSTSYAIKSTLTILLLTLYHFISKT